MVDKTQISEQLLIWYDCCSRDLPWRRQRDPYRIWVSEVMLQQTRVAVVKEYYRRFIERFPTGQSLAEASDDAVLTYWQGLGYYSRARNLQRGVREVQAHYGGKIPDSRAEIEQIPGIGPYIAGAILSMAYQQAEPAVDGNVLRIFSRLLNNQEDISKPSVRRQISEAVQQCISTTRPGDFNQALMDLGSLVCTPRNPQCASCCLAEWCEAFKQGCQDELPVKATKRPPRTVYVAVGILAYDGRYLIVQRPSNGLLASMWQFPAVEIKTGQSTDRQLTATFAALGQEVEVTHCWRTLTHTFSHCRWLLNVYTLQSRSINPAVGRWVAMNEFDSVLWAGPNKKIMEWCRAETKAAGS